MITWKIFEITTKETLIQGVMLRGRLRKLAIQHKTDLLTENSSDKQNCVRFAIKKPDSEEFVIKYIRTILEDSEINLVADNVTNPVLSKIKVNDDSRYTL
jgi:hypothetical protein